MSDLISREAVENITWEEPSYSDPLNVLTEVRDKVRELPSADIMECARALKKWCEKRQNREDYKKCPFHSTDPMWICSVSYCLPKAWDLPKGEAKPNESLIKDCCEAQGHLWADNNIFEDVEENQ